MMTSVPLFLKTFLGPKRISCVPCRVSQPVLEMCSNWVTIAYLIFWTWLIANIPSCHSVHVWRYVIGLFWHNLRKPLKAFCQLPHSTLSLDLARSAGIWLSVRRVINARNQYGFVIKTNTFEIITSRIWEIPNSDFQSFFKVFTHISPLAATFGWNIFVTNSPIRTFTSVKAKRWEDGPKDLTFGSNVWEFLGQYQLHFEISIFIRCTVCITHCPLLGRCNARQMLCLWAECTWSTNPSLNICQVGLIDNYLNIIKRCALERIQLAWYTLYRRRIKIYHRWLYKK